LIINRDIDTRTGAVADGNRQVALPTCRLERDDLVLARLHGEQLRAVSQPLSVEAKARLGQFVEHRLETCLKFSVGRCIRPRPRPRPADKSGDGLFP